MKLIIIILGLSLVIFSSCAHNCKKIDETEKPNIKTEMDTKKLSPQTAIFMQELNKEVLLKENSKEFIPSQELIDKYGLKLKDGKYYIACMVKTDEQFVEKYFLENDISIRTKAGNIYTLNINILQLFKLSEIETVLYIQIDEKLKIK